MAALRPFLPGAEAWRLFMCSCWEITSFQILSAVWRCRWQRPAPTSSRSFRLAGDCLRPVPASRRSVPPSAGPSPALPGASGGSSSSAIEVSRCGAARRLLHWRCWTRKTSADNGMPTAGLFPWFLPRGHPHGTVAANPQRGSILIFHRLRLRVSPSFGLCCRCGGLWLKGPPKESGESLACRRSKSCSRPLIRVSSPSAPFHQPVTGHFVEFLFLCPKFFIPWQLHLPPIRQAVKKVITSRPPRLPPGGSS